MTFSRRSFLKWSAAVSSVAAAGRSQLVPLLAAPAAPRFKPNLLPSQKDVWDQQVWMAKLGPKYTGNKAHTSSSSFSPPN